jgi:hypothetical protein
MTPRRRRRRRRRRWSEGSERAKIRVCGVCVRGMRGDIDVHLHVECIYNRIFLMPRSNRKQRSRCERQRRRDLEAQGSADDDDGNETVIEYTSGSESDASSPEPPRRRRRYRCGYKGCARDTCEMFVALTLLLWLLDNIAGKYGWYEWADSLAPSP